MGVTIGNFDRATPPPPDPGPDQAPDDRDAPQLRKVILTPASTIKPRRVRWIWDARIAEGTIALLAGREGLGKSTLAYDLAAQVTRGTLEGEYLGRARSVLICASEDSWEHTIVPRLIAARADLDRVYRVEIERYDGLLMGLSLPRDFKGVEEAAATVDAGLMVLDPLMSVIDSRLDTHKDAEVRQALDPLSRLADRAHLAIVGLIHHNKSGSTDALQLVMGSKAFSAVARSVHTCIPDPDDETGARRLFATSKNNLGRLDLPVLGFTITSHAVETEDDGTAYTGRLNWTGEIEGSMQEIMTRTADPERTATAEAADWLRDYLVEHGGEAAKTDIEKAGRVSGHPATVLRRARERLRLEHRSWGFPRQTLWSLPGTVAKPDPNTGGDKPDDVTEPRHPADDRPTDPAQDEPDTPLDGIADDPTDDPTDDLAEDPSASRVNDPAPSSRVTGDDATADRIHSRVTSDNPAPVASVASTDDTTVTQLGLTSENTASRARAHTRAGGDDSTDTTGRTTPPQSPSRVSRVSRVTAPPRTHAHEDHSDPEPWSPPPDADIPVPTCIDCGWPLDTTQHATTCEEAP